MRLDGKVAVVTGAGSGIGQAIAIAFAREGAHLALADVRIEGLQQVTTPSVLSIGRKAFSIAMDVSKPDEVQLLADQAAAELGQIDLWVNNAGISGGGSVLEMREDLFDRVLAVNLRGPFLGTQAAARAMVRQGSGGVILNISSIAGDRTVPGQVAYSAAKAGLNMLTRVAAWELGPHKIRVNAIAPATIRTPMSEPVYRTPERIQPWLDRLPLRRPGHPADIASTAVFLASEEASYITGQVFHVDGGWSLLNGRAGMIGSAEERRAEI